VTGVVKDLQDDDPMTSQTGAAAYCQRLSIWQPTVMNEGGLPSSTAHINQEFKEDYYD